MELKPILSVIDGEPIMDFVHRLFLVHRILNPSAKFIRSFSCFYEVKSKLHSDEMEEWCWENTGDGRYYYTTDQSLIGSLSMYNDTSSVSWFFNDEASAALFKLAFGIN